MLSKDHRLKDVVGLQEAAYGMVGDDLSRVNAERRYFVTTLQDTHTRWSGIPKLLFRMSCSIILLCERLPYWAVLY